MNISHEAQIGYLLHRWRYRENSLILAFWTRQLGVTRCLALGALRPGRQLISNFRPFQRLSILQRGKPPKLMSLKQLSVETLSFPVVCPKRFAIGSYLNDLLLKCQPEYTPEPQLYQTYDQIIAQLSSATLPILIQLLTAWEWSLMEKIGYACLFPSRVSQNQYYRYDGMKGFTLAPAHQSDCLSGEQLYHLIQKDFSVPQVARFARNVLEAQWAQHVRLPCIPSRDFLKTMDLF